MYISRVACVFAVAAALAYAAPALAQQSTSYHTVATYDLKISAIGPDGKTKVTKEFSGSTDTVTVNLDYLTGAAPTDHPSVVEIFGPNFNFDVQIEGFDAAKQQSLAMAPGKSVIVDVGSTVGINDSCSTTSGGGTATLYSIVSDCSAGSASGVHFGHLVSIDFAFAGLASDSNCATQVTGTFVFQDQPGINCATGQPTGGSGGPGGSGGTGGTGGGTPTPPPATGPNAAVILPDALVGQSLPMNPGGSGTYPINIQTIDGFTSDLTLSATSDAGPNSDFNVSVTPALIPAPGRGDATLNINVGPHTFPRSYYVNLIATTNEATPRTFSSGFLVNVICDPPMILGTAQPAAQSVARGATAQLTIPTPGGTGPFTYQWYLGHTGETNFPLTGATSQTLTTNPIFDNTVYYWVRVSNACGTADSQTATVSVTGATPTGHRRTTGGH